VKKVQLVAIVFLLVAVALVLPQPARAGDAAAEALQEYVKMIGGDLAARRDSAVKTLLQLSADESKKFWTIKKEYDKEFRALIDQRMALLKEYSKVHDKLTTEKANELAGRSFDIEAKRNTLHRKYYDRIAGEISPVIAIQYLQLQGQFETMFDMKLATNVPLAMRPE
jgi:hypothetical protein